MYGSTTSPFNLISNIALDGSQQPGKDFDLRLEAKRMLQRQVIRPVKLVNVLSV